MIAGIDRLGAAAAGGQQTAAVDAVARRLVRGRLEIQSDVRVNTSVGMRVFSTWLVRRRLEIQSEYSCEYFRWNARVQNLAGTSTTGDPK